MRAPRPAEITEARYRMAACGSRAASTQAQALTPGRPGPGGPTDDYARFEYICGGGYQHHETARVTGEDCVETGANRLAEQKVSRVITGPGLEESGIERWSNWRADLGHRDNGGSGRRGATIFEELFFTCRLAP